MTTIRVNVKTKVNNASIRREKRNGRDVVIVPSATLPDGVVMNSIHYPAEEIAKSFKSLERTPAPLGHPIIGNRYVSARDPEAINGHWVGAWNENVRRENGRVLLDKVIDVGVANSSENGRKLMEAINKGDPVHTSTGLVLEAEPVQNKEYKWVARNMEFDHDAILLGEQGAATPSQGVGMMVNAEGEEIEVQDINLDEEDLRGVAETVVWRLKHEKEQEAMKGMIDKVMDKLRELFKTEATGLSVNHKEETEMAISDEQFKALEEKVTTLATNSDKLTEAVAEAVQNAVTPLKEQIETLAAANKERDEADRTAKVEAVVNSGLLTEDEAKELPMAALNALSKKAKPGVAAPIAWGQPVTTNSADDLSDELPGEA